ncbi:hypothetical protein [Cellulomonas terrae]|uniref:hypothetical protein n=1 Tax=Cellulomonas terrae TaxID=311234 RepID=UPI0011BD7D8C|nr:hypothetical protein [Cellulomonas terrae]
MTGAQEGYDTANRLVSTLLVLVWCALAVGASVYALRWVPSLASCRDLGSPLAPVVGPTVLLVLVVVVLAGVTAHGQASGGLAELARPARRFVCGVCVAVVAIAFAFGLVASTFIPAPVSAGEVIATACSYLTAALPAVVVLGVMVGVGRLSEGEGRRSAVRGVALALGLSVAGIGVIAATSPWMCAVL